MTTRMGGSGSSFRTTIWSDILAAGDPTNPRSREHLERLLKTYWKPVFAYLRSAGRLPIEDAKDLTQGFFARFLEKEYWSRLDPGKGSFRGYLKRAVKHFLLNAKRDARTKGPPTLSIDAPAGELDRLGAVAPGETPEGAYDRAWFNSLMDAALQDLRDELARDGKREYYEIFKAYCLAADPAGSTHAGLQPAARGTYDGIAKARGLEKHDVRNHLAHCRRLLKTILRRHIRDYVATEEDLERELGEAVRG